MQRVVEGLVCGDGLEGLVVALELPIDIDGVGLAGKAAGGADFGIEAFAGGEPDELLRMWERQGTQQDGVDDAEDRGVEADAEGENQDGDGGKRGIVAQGAEGVAGILQAFGQ